MDNVISFEERRLQFQKKNEQQKIADQQRTLAGTASIKNTMVTTLLDTLRANGVDTRKIKGLIEITSLIDLMIDHEQGVENNLEEILTQIKPIINPPIEIA